VNRHPAEAPSPSACSSQVPDPARQHERIEGGGKRGGRVQRTDAATHREPHEQVARFAGEPAEPLAFGSEHHRDAAIGRLLLEHGPLGVLVEPDHREAPRP
jgi:hypothetical protein